jgi:heme/copper-type cytochrome/quinol oxidase subunit 2
LTVAIWLGIAIAILAVFAAVVAVLVVFLRRRFAHEYEYETEYNENEPPVELVTQAMPSELALWNPVTAEYAGNEIKSNSSIWVE